MSDHDQPTAPLLVATEIGVEGFPAAAERPAFVRISVALAGLPDVALGLNPVAAANFGRAVIQQARLATAQQKGK